jgi:F5/8 type C domain/Abnormal spindle-like microcephaly-assoc'd, ASPM-SPD-2-Hydin
MVVTHAGARAVARSALLVLSLAPWIGCSRDPIAAGLARTSGLVTANNTITQAADEGRTGWFPDQPLLDPATVASRNFGRMWKTQLQTGFSQQVLAQPLVVGGQVLVVTEANNLYLVDARTGAVTRSRNLGPAFDAATTLGCADVIPTVGITGTPVVDASVGTAYFYSKSDQGEWSLHAVSTADLSERPGFPVTISGTAHNDATATFNSTYQLQRPGLLLMNGVVYAGFGAHCDIGPYRGWIVGVTTSGSIRTLYTTQTDPTADAGNGIWMSGAGLVSDGPGQILFSTGNGDGNPYFAPLLGSAPPGNLQDAVGRVAVQADGSLKTTDFFAPFGAIALNQGDLDLGSGGVVALPAQFGTSEIPHLAIIAGKGGTLYLLDRDNLGGFSKGPSGGDAALAAIPLGGASWSRPGVWPGDGGYVYVTVNGGTSSSGFNLQVFKYGTDAHGNPTLTQAGVAPENVGSFSGSPIVTSNGTTSGSALVWMTNLTSELRVYDAVPINGALNIRFRDAYGVEAKFTTIGVGAGAAYIGTGDGYLVGYGVTTPSVSGNLLAFGTVGVGQTSTLTATITANQNVTVTAFSSSSAAFVLGTPAPALPATLTAGQSLSLPVTFRPTSATNYEASLNITTSSTPGALTMTGTGQANGPQLAVLPSSLDFGGVAIGTSKSIDLSLSNSGNSSLTFSGVTPPTAPFSATSPSGTLAPGASTTVTVTFAPTAVNSYASSLTIGSNGGNVAVSLTGAAGTPANLVVTPLDNDFGTVMAGSRKTLSFTLQNTGGVDLTVVKYKPPVLGAFFAQTSLHEGSTIAAGQTITETVSFASNTTGVLSDVWQINGSDSTGLHTVTFTANSVAALPRDGWVATASATGGADVPSQAIDSAGTVTRWSSGLGQAGSATQSFTLDMLSPQRFSMISLDSGGDYARVWEIYASDDVTNWGTAIATGTATANPVVVTFATQVHRYLQIRQRTSPGTGVWWSIYDLNVYGLSSAPVSGPLVSLGWVATGSSTGGGDLPANAIDGDTTTRWSTSVAQSGAATQTLTLDMLSAQAFSQITMDSGGDYARVWQVYASDDGLNWGTAIATGTATASPVVISFAAQVHRYLQIRQLPSPGTGAWWSIYELNVYSVATPAPPPPAGRNGWTAIGSSTAGGDVAVNAIDADPTTRWSTGVPQSGSATQTFTLDMLSPQTFSVITMSSGGDFARVWEIYASDDGSSWGTAIATGTATASPVVVTVPSQTHRYLQLRQLPSPGTGAWWSINDLEVGTAPASGPSGRNGWVASGSSTAGGDVAVNAIDGNATTRWSTGVAQSSPATQSFTLDLGTAQSFNQIRMDSGGDFARSYQAYVSQDGVNWGSAVAAGSATASPVIVTFANETARFIQVRQLPSAGTTAWWSIYELNVIAGGTPPPTALARTGWAASASATGGADVPANAIDSSTGSRWSTGKAQSGAATQWFTLDMQSPQTISQITMSSGGDYARHWEAYLSSDGATWGAPVSTGTATANPVTVSFPSTAARYLQIRQLTSAGTGSWWSIYDLNVYGP